MEICTETCSGAGCGEAVRCGSLGSGSERGHSTFPASTYLTVQIEPSIFPLLVSLLERNGKPDQAYLQIQISNQRFAVGAVGGRELWVSAV